MKADTMNEKIKLPPPDIKFPGLCGDIVGYTVDHTQHLIECAILADRASRSRAASEPGEVARLAEASNLIEALLEVQMSAVAIPDIAGEHAIRTSTLAKVESALGAYSLTLPAKNRKRLPVTGCCGRSECGGECGNEWAGMEDVLPAPSPIAAEGQKAATGKQALQVAQEADALREALQNIANLEAPEVDADLLLPVRLARAALATPTASMADAAEAVATSRLAQLAALHEAGDPDGLTDVSGKATPGPRGENAGGAWISVDERLPPACTEVIARGRPYGTNKTILSCEFITYISTHPRECVEDDEITHWRLPDRGLRIAEKGDAS